MQKTRLESNVNENIVHEEIEILTQILLKATEKMTSKETFNKIIELKRLADNKEYEFYLKNMEDFFIVDFKPDLQRELYGVFYLSMTIKNEFEYETNNSGEVAYGNDDLGFSTGYGHSKSNEADNRS